VHGQALKDKLVWFQFDHVKDRCSKRMGIVKARNTQSPAFPGEYYVMCTHNSLERRTLV
jgi:hypothetical protein